MNRIRRSISRRLGMLLLPLCWLPVMQAQAKPASSRSSKPAVLTLSDNDKAEMKSFTNRAKDYIKMERSLPADKLSPNASVAQLEQQREALRDAVRQARPNAKQGDIFTPAASAVIRKLLHQVMTRSEGPKIRTSLNHAEPLGPQDLKVNGVYPNVAGQPLQSVPPSLLLKLPALPKGLVYRISDHTLALRDTEANLVVDYLPDALP